MHWLRDTPYTYQALITISLFLTSAYIAIKNTKIRKENWNFGVWISAFIYCLFAFCDGDYFHYKEIFIDFKDGETIWSLEDVYLWILDQSPSYEIFRSIIWGGGLLLLYDTAKRLNTWNPNFTYLFIAFNIQIYSYARVSLAVSIATFGYSLLICDKNIIRKAVGIIFIIASFYFHKSIVIVLILIPFTLIPWGKRWSTILIICLPIFIHFVNNYILDYILTLNLNDAQNNAVNGYILQSNYSEERGIARLIIDTVVQIPIYIGLLIALKYYKCANLPKQYKYMFRWSVLIILVATSFILFPFTRVLYYRLMFIGRIPLLFTLSILLSKKSISKPLYNYFFISCWAYDIMKLSYSLYLSIVS